MAGAMTGSTARRPVIAGLGITEMGKVYGRTTARFAADAVRLAVADAGLELSDVDGLLTNTGMSGGVGLGLQQQLQLRDLRIFSEVQSFGASAGAMVSYASMAVQSGMADTVVCVFADAPLREGQGSAGAYSGRRQPTGFTGLIPAAGLNSTTTLYALAARRHMETYGTTSEQLGAIAVAQRAWATMNPLAQMRTPITLADHQASRWIAEPLHLLDCCLVSNGGIAVVVTSAERAAQLRQPPVHVLGFAQSHPGCLDARDSRFGLESGATLGPAAVEQRRRPVGPSRIEDGRALRVRRGHRRAVRLLHVHRPADPGGLRFLRQGRGWPFRLQRRPRPGRLARGQHRRRAAVLLLHVGHDPALRSDHPGSRPGRPTAGPTQRRDPRQRQRRHPGPPLHARAQPPPAQLIPVKK